MADVTSDLDVIHLDCGDKRVILLYNPVVMFLSMEQDCRQYGNNDCERSFHMEVRALISLRSMIKIVWIVWVRGPHHLDIAYCAEKAEPPP